MTTETPPPQTLRPQLDEERFEAPDLRALLNVLKAATRITVEGDEVLRRASAGVRLADFDVLAFVYAAGSIRPSELMRQVAMSGSAPTIHNIISRLEDRGFVARTPHPDDARGVLVSITDEGRAAVDETFPLIERKVINRFASQFSAEELATIADLLGRH